MGKGGAHTTRRDGASYLCQTASVGSNTVWGSGWVLGKHVGLATYGIPLALHASAALGCLERVTGVGEGDFASLDVEVWGVALQPPPPPPVAHVPTLRFVG